jgi:hypothetical protein
MSQKNVELVRGAFGVVTIPGDPEAMVAASHPGFEMHLIRVAGEPVFLVLGDVRGGGRVSGVEVETDGGGSSS